MWRAVFFCFHLKKKNSFTSYYFLQVPCGRPCFSFLDFRFHFELFHTFFLKMQVLHTCRTMWPAVLPTCVYWPHLHSRSTWDEFRFLTLVCLFFYKTIKQAHIWMGKTFLHKCCIPFCTKSIHNFKYLRKLISCSPRRWLVSERTVCSCTLRPRSWLLPGCCQYEYICDFLLYWYIFVMILYQYIDKWLPYLWYRVTVKNSNHNVFFKFVLFKRIIILE